MDEHLLILNEREQQKADEAQKQTDNAAYKKIHAEAVVKWNEKCQMFCLAGLPMTCAGKKPLFCTKSRLETTACCQIHHSIVMPHAFHNLIPIFSFIHSTTPNPSEPNQANSNYHYPLPISL